MINNKTRIKKTMVISVLAIIALLITGILSMMERALVSAYAMTETSGQADSKIYSEATVDDDFAENSMLVILSEQATLSFKVYTKDNFPEFNCYVLG